MIRTMPTDITLAETIRLMVDWVVDLYQRLGRYQLEFIEESGHHVRSDIGPALITTYAELGERASEMLDEAASRDGITLVESDYRITWFWAGCIGTAERMTLFRLQFEGDRREEHLQFAAESLTRSLIVDGP